MKIKSLCIQGFRGFNELCEPIEFHDKITLIAGHNSYGKTSISEALEWLLFGVTSKVEAAAANNTKTEYLGTYRNCHFPDAEIPFVEAVFKDNDDSEVIYRGELQTDDSTIKQLNNEKIDDWPWALDAIQDPRPFVLQHSLKQHLLTSPTNRYQNFTRMIGADELNLFQESVVSLCTKYESHIPDKVQEFRECFKELEQQLTDCPGLNKIQKIYKKKPCDLSKLYRSILDETHVWVSDDICEDEVISELQKVRRDKVQTIFDKSIMIDKFSENEAQENRSDIQNLSELITDDLTRDYLDLLTLSTIQEIQSKFKLYKLGIPLLEESPKLCPFCGLPLGEKQHQHIYKASRELGETLSTYAVLEEKRIDFKNTLTETRKRINNFHTRYKIKSNAILDLNTPHTQEQLKELLSNQEGSYWLTVEEAVAQLLRARSELVTAYQSTADSYEILMVSINESKEDIKLLTDFGSALAHYLEVISSYEQALELHYQPLKDAERALRDELDKQAGTKSIAILIEFLSRWDEIVKRNQIEEILNSLKVLRKEVDRYATDKMEKIVKESLSRDVLEWYDKIKTSGDPDVHFSGFEIPQTRSGTAKARQIGLNATSYDVPLPSAVATLSESKLNALGLSISVANSVKGSSVFDFLVIDDPVQSLDKNHSVKIIDVIRTLVEERGKQVILLSHDFDWIGNVRKSCRTLNGYYYEITNYSKKGPNIQRRAWGSIDERYQEVKAYLDKESLTETELQRVGDEFRLLFNELAADISMTYQKIGKGSTKSTKVNPDKLNRASVRTLLLKTDMKPAYIDKVDAAYYDMNAPHHLVSYGDCREKLRSYLDLVEYLRQYLNDIRRKSSLRNAEDKIRRV